MSCTYYLSYEFMEFTQTSSKINFNNKFYMISVMNTSTSRTGNKAHMGSMTKIIEMFHKGYSSFKHKIICVAIFNMIAMM